jgi:hypothetical protein
MHGRHRLVRSRRGLGIVTATGLVAGVTAWSLASSASPVAAADACTTPALRDVMVSQGLPSYTSLTRGKSALARFYLSAPSCIPAGTTLNITNGSLVVGSNVTPVEISSPVPLPPLGPITTSPVQQSEADPYFLVPGTLLNPPALGRTEVSFSATFDFAVSRAGQVVDTGRITFDKRPGTTNRITAFVEGTPQPLRTLVVRMGDAGTAAAPKTVASQFPPATAEPALQRGMAALSRLMPLRDGISDLATKTGGLQYSVAAGMIDLQQFMPNGSKYCGLAGDFNAYIEPKLLEARNAWNKENPNAIADRVLGVIWEGISRGPNTDANSTTCIEGIASFSTGAAWARVIDERPGTATTPARPALTGSLMAMELAHTVGSVSSTSDNRTRHSLATEADGTAPDRAFNIANQSWIARDRTAQRFQTDGTWHDDSTLLEVRDWDFLQCYLTAKPLVGSPTATSCPQPGGLGGNAAASADRSGSFFLAGTTDGTAAGTEVDSYFDDNTRYEPPVADSPYRLVQRDALGRIVLNAGVAVSFERSDHTHADGANHAHTSDRGSFGTELESDADTVRIEFWKGNPATSSDAVLLYSRNKDVAPQVLSVNVAGTSVSLVATDDNPADLRLYAHHVCPGGTSPLFTNERGTTVGRTTVFVERIDLSGSCSGGQLLFTVGDGYLTAQQADAASSLESTLASAAIYEPAVDAAYTVRRAIALSGSARDRVGRELDDIAWFLDGPGQPGTEPIAIGKVGTYQPPAEGLLPGTYTLRMVARDGDTPVVTATRTLTVLADDDFDGLSNAFELAQSCYGASAKDDPLNAVADSDLDGTADIVDPAPCVTTSNITVDFNPNSFNLGSSGNTFSARVSGSPVDLRTLPLSAWEVQQVAGYKTGVQPDGSVVRIRPVSVNPDTATTATVKFDRGQLAAFMQSKKITGTTPIFIGSSTAGLRGVDAIAPDAF